MDVLQAIILAIIEGITEFLPVSSTGHMIIAPSFFGIAQDDFTKLFTIVKSLVKSSCAMPKKDEAIIMCPVEEIGKNSVIPSIMARIMACKTSIKYYFFGFFKIE